MKDVLILGSARTPIGSFQGALASLPAPKLGAIAIKAALERAATPADAVGEVYMGCVLQAGIGQAPARQAAIGAGVPDSVGAVTVNKMCGSGLKAVVFGHNAIASGEHDVVVAGGMESMTNAPYLLPKAREGLRMGHGQVIDSMITDGLWDARNVVGEAFTRLLIGQHMQYTMDDPLADAVTGLVARVTEHVRGTDFEDDVTILGIERVE